MWNAIMSYHHINKTQKSILFAMQPFEHSWHKNNCIVPYMVMPVKTYLTNPTTVMLLCMLLQFCKYQSSQQLVQLMTEAYVSVIVQVLLATLVLI